MIRTRPAAPTPANALFSIRWDRLFLIAFAFLVWIAIGYLVAHFV